MLHNKGRVTTLARTSADELKKDVDKSCPKDIISYRGSVYEIHFDELRNLGLDFRKEIEARTKELGLMQASLFEKHCLFCANHRQNISTFLKSGIIRAGETATIEENPDKKPECQYQSTLDIQVAKEAQNNRKKRKKFYAVAPNCAFDDALISFLADYGLLKPYETGREFNFRPLSDFEQGHANPKDFEIKRKPLIRGWLTGKSS